MIRDNLESILKELPSDVKLVAVSKFHPVESLLEAYACGQKCFGESRPQELLKKAPFIPEDAEIHFIGHLQTNKLKMVLPYVSMVESVDSEHLLGEIDKWCAASGKVVDILLEMHIGVEKTKQGFNEEDALDLLFRAGSYRNVRIRGLMGMASNTGCEDDIRADFSRISSFYMYLRDLFPEYEHFDQLSIGMSDDWKIALEYGATEVRIGTSIFGPRSL